MLKKTLMAIAATALMANAAQANVVKEQFQNFKPAPYVGVKAGVAKVDINNFPYQPIVGLAAGVDFDGGLGVEADANFTNTVKTVQTEWIHQKAKTNNYGIYATYKHNLDVMPVYVKAKLGFATTHVKLTTVPNKPESKELTEIVNENLAAVGLDHSETIKDSRVAAGLGVGYKVNDKITAEAMYNHMNRDFRGISAGVNYKF